MVSTAKRYVPALLAIMVVAAIAAVLFALPQHASADDESGTLVVAQSGEGEGEGEEKTDPLEGKTAPAAVKTKTINKQPVKNGTYIIEPVASRGNLVGAANKAGGARMKVASEWAVNNLSKWKFNYNYSKKAYTIVNVGSKKALTLAGNKVVQKKLKKKKKNNKRQLWCVVATNTGYKIYSKKNKKYVFTLSGSSIVTARNNNGAAQRYGISPVSGWVKGAKVKPGTYALYNYGTGKVMQLKFPSFRNWTDVIVAGDTGVLDQKFDVTCMGGDSYRIVSASTDRPVVYKNKLAISNNAGSLAERWIATKKDNGGFILANGGHAGQVLRASADGSVSLVTVAEEDYTANDYWAFIPTSCGLTAYQRLGLQKANTKLSPASKTNYYISIDKTAHFLMVYERDDGDSEWEVLKTWRCSTVMHKHKYDKNKDHYTSGHKWLVHDEMRDDGYCYRAKYWTHLGWGVAIHSILFKYQSNSIKDGRIGASISGGCTRLPVSRAKWIHANIPGGTGTSIYYK